MSDEEYDSAHLEYNSDDSLECPEDMDMSALSIGIYTYYIQRRQEDNPRDPERLLVHVRALMLLMMCSLSIDKPFMVDKEILIDDFVERALIQLKEDVVLGQVEVSEEFDKCVEVCERVVTNYRLGVSP
jgi:hypothetical protein